MNLYSDIFISKPTQTNSMFVYLTWNKNGKKLKTMLEYHKAVDMCKKMEALKVHGQIIFEAQCPPKNL
jgi:cytochrome c